MMPTKLGLKKYIAIFSYFGSAGLLLIHVKHLRGRLHVLLGGRVMAGLRESISSKWERGKPCSNENVESC